MLAQDCSKTMGSTSLTGKVWKVISNKVPESPSDLVNIILTNRGISDVFSLRKVTLKNTMPDPFVLVDMQKATERIVKAIYSGERVVVMGDYDVDGVSSTVLFLNFFEYIGAKCNYFIPNRIEEGYGLNTDSLKNYKGHLVIAVDCGSNSLKEQEYARSEGIDLVILDHHTMESVPFENAAVVALVNPHRPDETGNYVHLCAASVVFLCIVAINRLLREKGFYRERHIREPDLFDYLDLVALATVCDVMPLVGMNRAFVIQGIKTMLRRKNLGIDALINQNKTSELTVDTISFVFGPKINAAGRLAAADMSVKLLSTKNPIEAKCIAEQLDAMNRERQKLEQGIMEDAIRQIDNKLDFICAYSSEWHSGVVGIVAGRLKEIYHKPSLVIALDKNGRGRGSCRSIAEVDIAEIVRKAVLEGILSAGGGHAMAAGFSIEGNKIPAFLEFLKTEIRYKRNYEELEADCYLPAQMISFDMVESIAEIGPFGNGNRVPKFIISNLKISKVKVVGKNHLQVVFEEDCQKNDKKSTIIYGICFRSVGKPIGDILLRYSEMDGMLQALGTFTISEWKGRKTISFVLEDIATA